MLSFKRIAGSSSSSQAPLFSVSAETIANNEDLLTELLLRLPIKSLLKFKCVSKHWLSLISNPRFSRRRISCDTPPCGLFLIERGSPYAGYQFVALDSNHSKAPFKNLTSVNDPSEIKLIQSCNGLLLFHSLLPGRSGGIYYVYNPTTKQHTTIPGPSRAVGAALAFDPSKSPHYKVICVRKCRWLQHQYGIMMYSSNSGPWRVSGDSFTTKGSDKQFNGGVFCNGVIYWLDVSGTGVSLCFDIDGEKLEQMPPPPAPRVYDVFGRRNIHGPPPQANAKLDVHEMRAGYNGWFAKYHIDLDLIAGAFPEMIMSSSLDLWGLTSYAFEILAFVRGERDEDSFSVLLRIPGKGYVMTSRIRARRSFVISIQP
ncbi:hypothetical protein DKX38_001734 [Salix brachista]|uniref:F-box domain-containing protein n=1 Tax=Salix brachista TaxID=2182728 RepID=A0A5N5P3Z5_9ROSI|nr:hypothetical protein DKX38_001734 [Salix brachista]